jgi:nitrogen fixation-related uncharacterized protein
MTYLGIIFAIVVIVSLIVFLWAETNKHFKNKTRKIR